VRTTVTETDGDGNVIRTVNPAGVAANGTPDYNYDGTYTTSGEGDDSTGQANLDATIRVYDQNNQLQSVYLPWGCNLPAASAPSQCTTAQVQDNRRWRIDYARSQDGMDDLASVTQAYQWQNSGKTTQPATTYTYMPNGWPLSQTTPILSDATGNHGTQQSTTYSYDPAGDQISETEQGTGPSTALKRTSTRSWWPDGQPQEEDATGQQVAARIAIDDWTQTGQLQEVQSAAANSGGVLPGSEQENLCYDPDGRLSVTDEQVSNPNSQFDTVFSYDPDGNVFARSDNGQLGTGSFSCPSTAQNATLPLPAYTGGQTSTFTFDNLDRETTMNVASNQGDSPQQPTRTYTTNYWPSGTDESQTRSQQNGSPITENWYFNDDGKESQDVRSSDATNQTFAYDTDGNRITSENGNHVYNALDQEVMWTRGGPDTAGSGSQVSTPGTVTYTHDGDGALLQQTTATNYASIAIAGATVNESVQTTTRYCSTASAASLSSKTTAAQAAAMTMCTQDDGRVENTQTTSTVTGTVTIGGINTTLNIAPTTTTLLDCYDSLSELIEVVQSTNTCSTTSPTASHTSQYGYNDYGEVATQTVPYPTATSPNQTLTDSYGYDALGRRDEKSENLSSQSATNSTYGYIGLSTTAVGRGQGTTPAGKTFTDSYDYNSSGQPVGLYTTPNSSTTGNYYSYATDPNGTITGLEDSTGTVATDNQYHYTPYGEQELGSNQTSNPLGAATTTSQLTQDAQANQILFEGFQYNPAGSPDPATISLTGNLTTPSLPDADSYTLPARNYLPGQAIYQSPDSFEAASAEQDLQATPATQNPYAFVAGNPTSLIELDGHSECNPTCHGAGAVTYVSSPNGEGKPTGVNLNSTPVPAGQLATEDQEAAQRNQILAQDYKVAALVSEGLTAGKGGQQITNADAQGLTLPELDEANQEIGWLKNTTAASYSPQAIDRGERDLVVAWAATQPGNPDDTLSAYAEAAGVGIIGIFAPEIVEAVGGFVGGGAPEDADGVTQIVRTRPEPGADGGISNHIIEQQDGETTSVTHQVEVDGQVVHQHQTYIGKYGGQRQFPPEWSQFPDINAP
jgi:hypothetical protein